MPPVTPRPPRTPHPPGTPHAPRPPSAWGDSRRRRVGLLGGSFNPAHAGHLYISQAALCRLGLNEVWWLVSPQNPLKGRAGMAPLSDRLAQATKTAATDCRLRVFAPEKTFRSAYTADTLRTLQSRFPNVSFVWLMGADNLVQIPRWHRWMDIFQTVPVAILDRGPYSGEALAGRAAHRLAATRCPVWRAHRLADLPPPAWVFLPIRRHPASSTALRAAGGDGSLL